MHWDRIKNRSVGGQVGCQDDYDNQQANVMPRGSSLTTRFSTLPLNIINAPCLLSLADKACDQPFDTDIYPDMRWVSNLSSSSLGAAGHLWLCANCCAEGNSEEEHSHGYLSHMTAGNRKTTFHVYCTHWSPATTATTSQAICHITTAKRSNRWSGTSGSWQLTACASEACWSVSKLGARYEVMEKDSVLIVWSHGPSRGLAFAHTTCQTTSLSQWSTMRLLQCFRFEESYWDCLSQTFLSWQLMCRAAVPGHWSPVLKTHATL